jgi:hypothetical protein
MNANLQDFAGLGASPRGPSVPPAAANTFMTSLVKDVTLRSQFTPSYTWTPQAQTSTQGGLTDVIMKLIKPAADVRLPTGNVIQVAPWGTPTANYFPLVALGVVAMGVLVAGGLIAVGRRLG